MLRSVSSSVKTRRAFSSSARSWKVDNPYSGDIYCEVPLHTTSQATKLVESSSKAFQSWRKSNLNDRVALIQRVIQSFEKNKDQIAKDITCQMGKPLGQASGEVGTMIARAKALIDLAPQALQGDIYTDQPNLDRKITKEPIGVVLCLSPWNYPLLCSVNTVVAAVLTGNSVVLKHSDRTPLCASHFERAFKEAGAPDGLVQALNIDHDQVSEIVRHPLIQYVSFTGSVAGGRAVYSNVAQHRFIDVGLELGGKDGAYVTDNVDLQHAIDNVVDGAFYNAGQSCCSVERVFVHEKNYEAFLTGATKVLNSYVLGNPLDSATSLGPLAQAKQIDFLTKQVENAKSMGARVLVGGKATHDKAGKGRFFAPTLLADCTDAMNTFKYENFGPILSVTKVKNDEEALQRLNSSDFGLTSSIWTKDLDRANAFASEANTGTVYMNRCDFLDPYLPWSGRKDSGKGIGLSKYGFGAFLRTKGFNFRPKTQ